MSPGWRPAPLRCALPAPLHTACPPPGPAPTALHCLPTCPPAHLLARPPGRSYALTLPELEYQSSSSVLAVQLAADHVAGVYEERLPLALHAALQLGCAAAVSRLRCWPPWRALAAVTGASEGDGAA